MSPAISVVIPTHNRGHRLQQLLHALATQSMPPDRFEVVVSIDGSTDGTRGMLVAFAPRYRLTWSDQPKRGRAAACNAGIARARGRLIVLLDDDMEPTPGFLLAHEAEHPDGSRRAVMGAAPIRMPAGAPPTLDYVARKFNRHLETLAVPGRTFGLRDFYTGNVSIPADVLREAGGFDEDFTAYGNEDVELFCRLRAAGVQAGFSAGALAFQHYDKDFRALANDNVQKGHTVVLLLSKHPAASTELRVSRRSLGALPRRSLLGALLVVTRLWPGMSERMVRVMCAAGRLRLPGLARAYGVALDYFFLLGLTAARRGEAVQPARS